MRHEQPSHWPLDLDDDYDDDDDRWQEYKDDLAMGYINPDGSQRGGSAAGGDGWALKPRSDRYDDEPPF